MKNIIEMKLPKEISVRNANSFLEKLFALPVTDETDEIILDGSDLEYISSMGLRILLRFAKQYIKPIYVTELDSATYEVFENTGFNEVFNIRKKARHIEVDGLKMLGRGMYGTVYKVDEETVLKVFYGLNSQETLDSILRNVRTAFVKGIPTIIPFETVKTDQGFGMVFELLNTDCIANMVHREPEKTDMYAQKMAELAKVLATTEFLDGTIKSRNEMLKEELESTAFLLSEEERNELKLYIDAAPEWKTAVHGDFHAGNVYMSNGEALLIDMDDFCLGHPIWDIACLYRVYPFLIGIDKPTAKVIFSLDDSVSYPDLYYHIMHVTLEEGTALWEAFIRYYFEGYTEEEKNKILEVAKFYSDYMVIRFLIDECKKVKDHPEKMKDKLDLIHSKLSGMREKYQNNICRNLELWR